MLPTKNKKGSALFIVLGCVALMTLLVVAFLGSSLAERSTSTFFAREVNTKLLAENAVNLVITQIRTATKSTSSIPANADNKVTWASQPGMIRTYDNTGNPDGYYKLYSWNNMVGAGQYTGTDVPDPNWYSEPDLYTDINEPVNSRNPIIATMDSNGNPILHQITVSGTTTPQYSYDTVVSGTADIEGFYVDPASTPGIGTGATVSSPNLVPMPVQWIYILKDGTQVTPVAAASGVTVAGASATNPIIGRISFWTDDECSKVNINTAGEGTSWDVPVTWFQEDYGTQSGAKIVTPIGLATAVPNSGEYQRIPGHPATTCLSTVFGQVLPLPTLPYTETTFNFNLAPYYTLTPRYAPGGTKGGTRPAYDPTGVFPSTYTAANLVPVPYRLYTSVDEMMFDPARMPLNTTSDGTWGATSAGGAGISPTTGRPQMSNITPAFLNEAQFFLTANSKGPETTLFNTPRISMWPVQTDATNARNAKDNLLAYCATINAFPYYFQRSGFYASSSGTSVPVGPLGSALGSSQDPVADMGGSVASSGGGVTPGSPSSSVTGTGVLRNQNLLAYLQAETSAAIPGFGGNFLSKYPAGPGGITDRDQILVDMFDYIRSTINTISVAYSPSYTYTPVDTSGNDLWGAGMSLPEQVTISGTTVMGLGRSVAIAEVSIIFIPAGFYDQTTLNETGTTITLSTGTVTTYPPHAGRDGLPDDVPGWTTVTNTAGATSGTFVYDGIGDPQTTAMQAFLVIRPMTVDPSIAKMNPCVRYSVTGLDQWSVSGGIIAGGSQNLGFNSGATIADGAVGTNSGSKTVLLGTSQYNSASALLFGPLSTISPVTTWSGSNGKVAVSGTITTGTTPLTSNGDNPTVATNPAGFTTGNALVYPLAGKVITFSGPANASAWGGQNGTTLLRTGQEPSMFSLNTGNQKIKLTISSGYPTAGATAPVIQTYDLNFPNIAALPVPAYVPAYVNDDGADGGDNQIASTTPTVYQHPRITYSPTPTPGQNQLSMEFYTQLPNPIDNLNTRLGANTIVFDTTNNVPTNNWFWQMMICRGDTVRSLVPNPLSAVGGDMRVIANLPVVPYNDVNGKPIYNYIGTNLTKDCTGAQLYGSDAVDSGEYSQFSSLLFDYGNLKSVVNRFNSGPIYSANPPGGINPPTGYTIWPSWGGNASAGGQGKTGGSLVTGAVYANSPTPAVTPELTNAVMTLTGGAQYAGDWSNGYGNNPDGPLVQGADEGMQAAESGLYQNPWYELYGGSVVGGNSAVATQSFSPNRQVASPVMFGTLPAGVQAGTGWRNLLFCPNPAAGSNHPGFGVGAGTVGPTDHAPYTTPPDHLLLDLFWMPVVDPYAISEPLATAGKVNMNYQIVPFSYIHRSTAVRAVLKSVHFLALPLAASSPEGSSGPAYKQTGFYGGYNSPVYPFTASQTQNCRYAINLDETIDAADSGFQARFANNDIFRSASEICNIFLVPAQIQGSNNYVSSSLPSNYAATAAWWSTFQLTGINSRESPYNQIYPRLTTKSNTFMVHFRVQTLVKNSTTNPRVFDTTSGDSVGGEYRGSSIVERYIDPNDTKIPDFAAGANSFTTAGTTLDNYYRYKVVRTKSFNP